MRWALLALLAFALPAPADDAVELPTRRTVILSSGATYFVEGRLVIGPGTEITIQKGSVLQGRGSNAVLEVQGALKIRGVKDQECMIENLVIEPAARFDEIRIDTCKWRSGAVRTAPDVVAEGTLSIENSVADRGVGFDVKFGAGEVRMLNTNFYDAVKVVGGICEGKEKNTLDVNIISCYAQQGGYSGLLNGLHVTGANEVVLRTTRVAGVACELIDCGSVTFDGNKIDTGSVLFRHAEAGGLRGLKLQKTDFHGAKIRFEVPEGRSKDKIYIDKCWFKNADTAAKITETYLEGPAVHFHIAKISKRPLELAG